MVTLKRLNVEKFRHIEDTSIDFGKYLTVISGLNGTGKSSILGLAGHLFSFREKVKKNTKRTLSGDYFETEYSEIFRFCPEHDLDKIYKYEAILEENDEEISKSAKSRYSESEKRFRIDVGGRKEGEGKIVHPVIFLGLRRLFPLAQEKEKDFLINTHSLEERDTLFYKNESEEIFVSLQKNINPQHIKTKHKDFLSIQTKNYNIIGNSAGQDNIGQILTSVISLKKLNQGGVLLIDELDTTLFPGAQINLIKRLYGYARRFNLQIIFTTHSLEIIKFLNEQNYEGEDESVKAEMKEDKEEKESISVGKAVEQGV